MLKSKSSFLTIFTLLALLLLMVAVAYAAVGTLRESVLRESPSFLGKVVQSLPAGAKVEISTEQGAWSKVKVGGKQGWLPNSVLYKADTTLTAGTGKAQTKADSAEVVLAGKGFTQEVEKEYRTYNAALDYASVDLMETYMVPDGDAKSFLSQGLKGVMK